MIIDEEKLKEFGRAIAASLPEDYWGKVEFDIAGGFCVGVRPQPNIKFNGKLTLKDKTKTGN